MVASAAAGSPWRRRRLSLAALVKSGEKFSVDWACQTRALYGGCRAWQGDARRAVLRTGRERAVASSMRAGLPLL